MKTPSYTEAEAEYIRLFHREFTATQIAADLRLPLTVISNFGQRYKLKFKAVIHKVQRAAPPPLKKRIPAFVPDPPKIMIRPAAEYSNTSPYGIASKERHL